MVYARVRRYRRNVGRASGNRSPVVVQRGRHGAPTVSCTPFCCWNPSGGWCAAVLTTATATRTSAASSTTSPPRRTPREASDDHHRQHPRTGHRHRPRPYGTGHGHRPARRGTCRDGVEPHRLPRRHRRRRARRERAGDPQPHRLPGHARHPRPRHGRAGRATARQPQLRHSTTHHRGRGPARPARRPAPRRRSDGVRRTDRNGTLLRLLQRVLATPSTRTRTRSASSADPTTEGRTTRSPSSTTRRSSTSSSRHWRPTCTPQPC